MFLEKLIRINTRFISSIFNSLYDWLLPPCCILCGYATHCSHNICIRCQQNLPILPNCCQQCARFLPVVINTVINTPLTCGACLNNPPPFDRTYALFPYEPPITQLVINLKFQHQFSVAKAMGDLFIQKLQVWYANQPLPDLIIPIPLHPKRLRERGYNQALEIARPIANTFAIPIDYHSAKRIKHTFAQSSLVAADRKQNMENAFKISGDYSGLTIAVIDDVITTGHTITECCKALKQHGAKHIDVWCCARRG